MKNIAGLLEVAWVISVLKTVILGNVCYENVLGNILLLKFAVLIEGRTFVVVRYLSMEIVIWYGCL